MSDSKDTKTRWYGASTPEVIYVLGFIGALFYYIPRATTLTLLVIGILKSLVWPAIIVYQVFLILKI